jgi:hypothetical protein
VAKRLRGRACLNMDASITNPATPNPSLEKPPLTPGRGLCTAKTVLGLPSTSTLKQFSKPDDSRNKTQILVAMHNKPKTFHTKGIHSSRECTPRTHNKGTLPLHTQYTLTQLPPSLPPSFPSPRSLSDSPCTPSLSRSRSPCLSHAVSRARSDCIWCRRRRRKQIRRRGRQYPGGRSR